MRHLLVGAIALALGCSAACSTGSTPHIGSTPSPVDQLAALALAGSRASYIAHYRLEASNPPLVGTAVVYRMPGRLRLDLHAGGQDKQVFVDKTGTYACRDGAEGGGGAASCATLAKESQPIPPARDPGLQHVFTDELTLLASGAGLSVSDAGGDTASGLSARCFAVTAVPSGSSLVPGTFCFTPSGVPSSAVFADGQMTLVKVQGTPTLTDFTLPATPAA